MLVALGGNLPWKGKEPLNVLKDAIISFSAPDFTLLAASRFFATPCFPAGAGPDYVNAAILLESVLSPAEILQRLHKIEAESGRQRDRRWGGRTLDLDLIAVDDLVLPDRTTWQVWHDLPADRQSQEAPDRLILPHPRLQDRAFVLVPLADVAPDWRHPVSGRTVREMLKALSPLEIAEVRPL